ncbi:sensor histidine kinase [Thalassiella azotivora]
MRTTPPRDATGAQTLRWHWEQRGGLLSDLSYLTLAGLYTTAVGLAQLLDGGGVQAAWHVTVNALVGLSLLARRRYPLLPVGLGVVGTVVAGSEGLLALALFALAVRRRDRVLVVVAAFALAAMVLGAAVAGINAGAATITSVFMTGAAVGLGAFVGARRDLVGTLRERAERAEAEQHLRADQARLAERARIAQEMHDVLAHKISLVALHAGGLEVRPDAGPEQVERAAGLIRLTAREALEDLRDVLGVLRDDVSTGGQPLAPQPRMQDVPALVEASARAGVPVTLASDLPDGAQVPAVTGRTAHRVVQEALTNVHKHAPGTATTVRLGGRPGGWLEVVVRNLRPVGGELEPLLPGSGMGLLGLGERVRLAGGRFTAGPDGDGFTVSASLPWPLEPGAPAAPPVPSAAAPPPAWPRVTPDLGAQRGPVTGYPEGRGRR